LQREICDLIVRDMSTMHVYYCIFMCMYISIPYVSIMYYVLCTNVLCMWDFTQFD
jgi:hypothetical protein